MSRLSRRRPAAGTIALGAAWLAAAVWVALRLDQGWVPHDDGSFAQSAQRVLDGELPHREFAELYTGGMTFLNAGVLWLLGENLIWLRIPVFVLFLAFVPCCYAIARRFVGPPAALFATAFAVTWSVPVYPAAVPSWYLLFFSCFGTYSLIRSFETGSRRWLLAAGLCGGLAISFKVVGIWLVLAGLIGLVAADQASLSSAPERQDRRPGLGGYQVLVLAAAVITLAVVGGVLAAHLGGAEIVNLLLPVAALCAVPVLAERRLGGAPARVRLRALGGRMLPYLVGVAAPVVALLAPYAVAGALPDLVDGVLVAPRSRLDYTYLSTPGPAALLWGFPVLAALLARHAVPRARRLLDVAGLIVLAVLLVTVTAADRSYLLLWDAARALGPLVVVLGAVAIALQGRFVADPARRHALLLVLLVAGLGSLVQYPFGAPVYFCYVAPLLALAAVGLAGSTNAGRGLLPIALLAGYAIFGLLFLDRAALATMGSGFRNDPQTVILDERRASIRVAPLDREVYRAVAAALERHGSGRFVFAGPDAPELYFLSGRRNPTRSLFDFVDTSSSARGAALLRSLREHRVTAVAINTRPDFSDPLEPATVQRLEALYPESERVGRFDVRWQRGR